LVQTHHWKSHVKQYQESSHVNFEVGATSLSFSAGLEILFDGSLETK
jgi:hypothetical protein